MRGARKCVKPNPHNRSLYSYCHRKIALCLTSRATASRPRWDSAQSEGTRWGRSRCARALAVINDDASIQAYDWYEQLQSHECLHYARDTPRSTGSAEAAHAGHHRQLAHGESGYQSLDAARSAQARVPLRQRIVRPVLATAFHTTLQPPAVPPQLLDHY